MTAYREQSRLSYPLGGTDADGILERLVGTRTEALPTIVVRFLPWVDHLLPFLVILTEGRDALVIASLRQGLVHEGG